jgi:hypothetical protein
VPIKGLAGLVWTDPVVVRRALHHLERMVADAPSLVNIDAADGMVVVSAGRGLDYECSQINTMHVACVERAQLRILHDRHERHSCGCIHLRLK